MFWTQNICMFSFYDIYINTFCNKCNFISIIGWYNNALRNITFVEVLRLPLHDLLQFLYKRPQIHKTDAISCVHFSKITKYAWAKIIWFITAQYTEAFTNNDCKSQNTQFKSKFLPDQIQMFICDVMWVCTSLRRYKRISTYRTMCWHLDGKLANIWEQKHFSLVYFFVCFFHVCWDNFVVEV